MPKPKFDKKVANAQNYKQLKAGKELLVWLMENKAKASVKAFLRLLKEEAPEELVKTIQEATA